MISTKTASEQTKSLRIDDETELGVDIITEDKKSKVLDALDKFKTDLLTNDKLTYATALAAIGIFAEFAFMALSPENAAAKFRR